MKSRVSIGARRHSSLLLSLVVLAGCGTNEARHKAVPRTPPGFIVHTVRDAHFSISLPKRWRSLDRRTALAPGRPRPFALANPRLQAPAHVLAGPNSPTGLIAVGTTGRPR